MSIAHAIIILVYYECTRIKNMSFCLAGTNSSLSINMKSLRSNRDEILRFLK